MVSSKYPREGEGIAPELLREVLRSTVPQSFNLGSKSLWQLDREIWTLTDRSNIDQLAEMVVTKVAARVSSLPNKVLSKQLPELPVISLSALNVELRTRGCLAKISKRYQVQNLADLSKLTIRHLLAIHGLGARSLVDLLTALEAMQSRGPIRGASLDASPGFLSRTIVPVVEATPADQPRSVVVTSSNYGSLALIDASINPRIDDGPVARHMPQSSGSALFDFASAVIGSQAVLPVLTRVQANPARVGNEALAHWPNRQSLEEELLSLVRMTTSRQRNIEIICMRFGWDGCGVRTQEDVGKAFGGISRQRVRQICEKFELRLSGSVWCLPTLDRAIEIMNACAPVDASVLAESLRSQGISQTPFAPSGILEAARLTGRSINVRMEEIGSSALLLKAEQSIDAMTILQRAKKLCRQKGVVNVSDICALLPGYSAESARSLIDSFPGVHWLDCHKDWFYVDLKTSTRLRTALKKIFSVTAAISPEDLYVAIKRVYSAHHLVPPPLPIILAFSVKVLDAKCSGGTVSLPGRLDHMIYLSPIELTMRDLIVSHGSSLDARTFQELSGEKGIDAQTFLHYLYYSPIFAKESRGYHALCGYAFESHPYPPPPISISVR